MSLVLKKMLNYRITKLMVLQGRIELPFRPYQGRVTIHYNIGAVIKIIILYKYIKL